MRVYTLNQHECGDLSCATSKLSLLGSIILFSRSGRRARDEGISCHKWIISSNSPRHAKCASILNCLLHEIQRIDLAEYVVAHLEVQVWSR